MELWSLLWRDRRWEGINIQLTEWKDFCPCSWCLKIRALCCCWEISSLQFFLRVGCQIMGELLSEIKAEVQYDSAPQICLGFMKFVLLIFSEVDVFLSCIFWMKMFYYLIRKTAFHFKYHLLLINKPKKEWILNNGKRRGQWIRKVIHTFVSETWISNYLPDSCSALSCWGKSMLQGLKAGSTGGLLPPSWMEAQETCLKCISSHPSICLRDKRWPPSNSFGDLLSKVF